MRLLLLLSCLLPGLLPFRSAVQPGAAVQFTSATRAAGISFVHFKGSNGTSTILEEAGPGVAVADYNNDGLMDLYFVNGRDLYNRGITARNALYRNNGDGTFTDVTDKAGVPGSGYGIGTVFGDYDNDGNADLYVTQYGKNILYRNNGNGTFTDVTDKAGVGAMDYGAVFHSGATFFDYDRDGRPDLYVGSYVTFGPGSRRSCVIGNGVPTSCPPSVYPGTPAILYHNNGDGTFSNVTKAARIYQPNGKNLSVGACDYDNDGWPDLFVANDGVEAYLYRNNHNGTFTDTAMTAGVALTADGGTMAAMCISHGDYDNDGQLDLYISDFQAVPNRVFRNDGKGFFDEVSDAVGIAEPTRSVLSFGGGFFDYDNDGWLDIFIANGHVYPEVEQATPAIHYKQINQLFHNDGTGRFVEVTKSSGNGFAAPYAGRGAAFADFDNDGNVDVVVANNGDAPLLLRNSGGTDNHFLNFKLVGTKSNRDATGTRIKVRSSTLAQIREISAGGSYFSHSDLRAHFGLGRSRQADTVEIWWPAGTHQIFRNVEADKFYLLEEGRDQLQLTKSNQQAVR
ncbi:MAG TPA: CRTAC1 family protein [Blastocatellia bacterium]|nr:CRTAC1 family protein [Blastocatellia bacterium]